MKRMFLVVALLALFAMLAFASSDAGFLEQWPHCFYGYYDGPGDGSGITDFSYYQTLPPDQQGNFIPQAVTAAPCPH